MRTRGASARVRTLAGLTLCATLGCTEEEVAPAGTSTPEQPFLSWTEPSATAAELRERRQALADALRKRGGGVFLAPARDGFSYGETFRQLDDFHYLVGLELPNSVLLVDGHGDATVFVPPTDRRFESASRKNDFPGRRLVDDPDIPHAADATLRDLAALDETVAAAVRDGTPLFVDLGGDGAPPATAYVFTWTAEQGLARHLLDTFPDAEVKDARPALAALRMVKSSSEIATLRRAAEVTADGIRGAAGHIRDGITERALEGELEAAFKRAGAQRLAFDSIIKSGPNSLWPWRILAAHYDRRDLAMRDGELVIFDVGCELDHYASDVGRTFPVSGRFDARQRRLVEMVTRASDAVIAAVRPGVTFTDLRQVAYDAIPEAEHRYMQTGLFFGHHVGLNVGDPSLPDVPLKPGMVFTVEPWYYNHDEEIAVFIEDEVLVTASGAENLTSSLPRSPDELERLVHRAR